MTTRVQRLAAAFILWMLFFPIGLGAPFLLAGWGVVTDSIGLNLLFTVVLVVTLMIARDVARARFWPWNQNPRT